MDAAHGQWRRAGDFLVVGDREPTSRTAGGPSRAMVAVGSKCSFASTSCRGHGWLASSRSGFPSSWFRGANSHIMLVPHEEERLTTAWSHAHHDPLPLQTRNPPRRWWLDPMRVARSFGRTGPESLARQRSQLSAGEIRPGPGHPPDGIEPSLRGGSPELRISKRLAR